MGEFGRRTDRGCTGTMQLHHDEIARQRQLGVSLRRYQIGIEKRPARSTQEGFSEGSGCRKGHIEYTVAAVRGIETTGQTLVEVDRVEPLPAFLFRVKAVEAHTSRQRPKTRLATIEVGRRRRMTAQPPCSP